MALAKKKKSMNTDAFNIGFKYGKGEISRTEANKLLKKSTTSGASLGQKVAVAFDTSRVKKELASKAVKSANSGVSAAKQEKAAISRGGTKPVKKKGK